MNKEISKEDFARLVQQYASQVLDFTTRLLSDRREAEEVAQDAFVKAFRSLDTFNFQSSFCTWVCRIAYHMSLDRLKRQHPYYVDIDNLPAIADEELSTGREERIALMEEAIDDLTNVEPNALATRLHRIRKKLSRMIKQKEHGQADR